MAALDLFMAAHTKTDQRAESATVGLADLRRPGHGVGHLRERSVGGRDGGLR